MVSQTTEKQKINRNDKSILITGASKGIGFLLAKMDLKNGFKVIGTSRSGKIQGIENENYDALKLDLSDFKNIEILKKRE